MIARGDLAGVLLLGPAFLLLLTAAELWARLGSPKPETTRKLVHVGGGLLCAFFPFFLRSPVTVLVLTVAFSAVIALGSRVGAFRSLTRVDRSTRGSEYFPLAVLAVFVLAGPSIWRYVASVLVLTVADAAAALVGSRYGRIRYEVDTRSKSLEGSLAFLAIAFFAIAIPCAWLTELPLAACLLAALLVSVLVTGFEAISLRGSDNLFVPIGVCVILGKITTKPLPEIVFQVTSLALIALVVILLVRRSRSFNTGGTIVFGLFFYGAWSLGSPYWALPILLAFTVYMLFWCVRPLEPVKSPVVFRALLVPLLVLVVANSTGEASRWFGPYLAAFATLTSLTLWNHLLQVRERSRASRIGGAAATAALAWLLTAGVPWMIGVGVSWSAFAGVGAVTLGASLLHDALLGREPKVGGENDWTALRFILTALSAAAFLLLQSTPLVGRWTPW